MTYKFPRDVPSPYYDAGGNQNLGNAGPGTLFLTSFSLQTEVTLSGDVDTTFRMRGVEDMLAFNPWLLKDPLFLATDYLALRLLIKVVGEHSVTLATSQDETLEVSSEGPMLPGSMVVFVLELYKVEGVPTLSVYESFRTVPGA
jgi:hypothetical protein